MTLLTRIKIEMTIIKMTQDPLYTKDYIKSATERPPPLSLPYPSSLSYLIPRAHHSFSLFSPSPHNAYSLSLSSICLLPVTISPLFSVFPLATQGETHIFPFIFSLPRRPSPFPFFFFSSLATRSHFSPSFSFSFSVNSLLSSPPGAQPKPPHKSPWRFLLDAVFPSLDQRNQEWLRRSRLRQAQVPDFGLAIAASSIVGAGLVDNPPNSIRLPCRLEGSALLTPSDDPRAPFTPASLSRHWLKK
jgi:hypothetical protein